MAMKVRYTVFDGEIVSEERNGVERDYLPDALGSTIALLDNTQAQTDTFTYWPYGEEKSRTGTTPTPFRFVGTAGYYRDSSTKIYTPTAELDVEKGSWLINADTTQIANRNSRYIFDPQHPLPVGSLRITGIDSRFGNFIAGPGQVKPVVQCLKAWNDLLKSMKPWCDKNKPGKDAICKQFGKQILALILIPNCVAALAPKTNVCYVVEYFLKWCKDASKLKDVVQENMHDLCQGANPQIPPPD